MESQSVKDEEFSSDYEDNPLSPQDLSSSQQGQDPDTVIDAIIKRGEYRQRAFYSTRFPEEELLLSDFSVRKLFEREAVNLVLKDMVDSQIARRKDIDFLTLFAGNIGKDDVKALFLFPEVNEIYDRTEKISNKIQASGTDAEVVNGVKVLLDEFKIFCACRVYKWFYEELVVGFLGNKYQNWGRKDKRQSPLLSTFHQHLAKGIPELRKIRTDLHSPDEQLGFDVDAAITKVLGLFPKMNPFQDFIITSTTKKRRKECILLMLIDLLLIWAVFFRNLIDVYDKEGRGAEHNNQTAISIIEKCILIVIPIPTVRSPNNPNERRELNNIQELKELAPYLFLDLLDISSQMLESDYQIQIKQMIARLVDPNIPSPNEANVIKLSKILDESPLTENGSKIDNVAASGSAEHIIRVLKAQAQVSIGKVYSDLENEVNTFCELDEGIQRQIQREIDAMVPNGVDLEARYQAAISNAYAAVHARAPYYSIPEPQKKMLELDNLKQDPTLKPIFAQLCANALSTIRVRNPTRYMNSINIQQIPVEQSALIKQIYSTFNLKRSVDYGFAAFRDAKRQRMSDNPLLP